MMTSQLDVAVSGFKKLAAKCKVAADQAASETLQSTRFGCYGAVCTNMAGIIADRGSVLDAEIATLVAYERDIANLTR
jgi:hypothetical protein